MLYIWTQHLKIYKVKVSLYGRTMNIFNFLVSIFSLFLFVCIGKFPNDADWSTRSYLFSITVTDNFLCFSQKWKAMFIVYQIYQFRTVREDILILKIRGPGDPHVTPSMHFFFSFWLFCSLWDLSSLTIDWTGAAAVKVPSPNCWTARKLPSFSQFSKQYILRKELVDHLMKVMWALISTCDKILFLAYLNLLFRSINLIMMRYTSLKIMFLSKMNIIITSQAFCVHLMRQ